LSSLEGVISGGQTGVDQAALRAAQAVGLATGGYAPLGYRTLGGPAPRLRDDFGLVESWGPSYAARTKQNVFHSDATVRIATDFSSSGEICTERAVQTYSKPCFNVKVPDYSDCGPTRQRELLPAREQLTMEQAAGLITFLLRHNVRVLNVAGNSEETSPGIGTLAERFLIRVFTGREP
jgi:hypothetical protein